MAKQRCKQCGRTKTMCRCPKWKAPCPLCGSGMHARLEIFAYPHYGRNLGGHCRVFVKFTCTKDGCRYEESTKGTSSNEETIDKLIDTCLGYRGPEMFKHGRFEQGNVGINRRRHTGIYSFQPVELPKEK